MVMSQLIKNETSLNIEQEDEEPEQESGLKRKFILLPIVGRARRFTELTTYLDYFLHGNCTYFLYLFWQNKFGYWEGSI